MNTTFNFFSMSEAERWKYLQHLSTTSFPTRYPVVVYLSFLSVVGAVGNTLVLLVYGLKFKPSATRVFVMGMALCDIVTNCLGLPLQIATIRYAYDLDDYWMCRGFFAFSTTSTQASGVLLVIVAVDRWQRVWYPFKRHLTSQRALTLVVFTVTLTSVIFAAFVPLYGIHRRVNSNSTVEPYVETSMCWDEDHYKGTMYATAYKSVVATVFFVGLLTMVVSYLLIGYRVWEKKKTRLYTIRAAQESERGSGRSPRQGRRKEDTEQARGERGAGSGRGRQGSGGGRERRGDAGPGGDRGERGLNLQDGAQQRVGGEETTEGRPSHKLDQTGQVDNVSPGEETSKGSNGGRPDDLLDHSNATAGLSRCRIGGQSERFKQARFAGLSTKKTLTSTLPRTAKRRHYPAVFAPSTSNDEDQRSDMSESNDSDDDETTSGPYAMSEFVSSHDDASDSSLDNAFGSPRAGYLTCPSGTTLDPKTSPPSAKENSKQKSDLRNSNPSGTHESGRKCGTQDVGSLNPTSSEDRAIDSQLDAARSRDLRLTSQSSSSGVISHTFPRDGKRGREAAGKLQRTKRQASTTSKYTQRVRSKTTLMMFVLTLFYIANWLPHLIFRFTWGGIPVNWCEPLTDCGLKWNRYAILIRSYYINSALNAFVYSFCNGRFRQQCLHLIRRR